MPNRSSEKAAAAIREGDFNQACNIALGVTAAMKRMGLDEPVEQIEHDFGTIIEFIQKGWSAQLVVERCYLPFGKFVLSSLSSLSSLSLKMLR